MSKRFTVWARSLPWTLFLWIALPGSAIAQHNFTKGSSNGVLNPNPAWSVGLQIGTPHAIVAQKEVFMGGSVLGGIGVYPKASVFADYYRYIRSDGGGLSLAEHTSFQTKRAKVLPYFGAGIEAVPGIKLRFPVGAQYTMLKDPVVFYGGGMIIVGLIDAGDLLQLGLQVGVRVLL